MPMPTMPTLTMPTPTMPMTDKAWLHKALWLINQMSQKLFLVLGVHLPTQIRCRIKKNFWSWWGEGGTISYRLLWKWIWNKPIEGWSKPGSNLQSLQCKVKPYKWFSIKTFCFIIFVYQCISYCLECQHPF